MKLLQRLRKSLGAVALLALGMSFPTSVSAEVLMEEYFEYNEGNLYNQGGWFRVSTQTDHPIQVSNPSLSFPGYQTVGKGLSARLGGYNDENNLTAEDLSRPFDANQIVNSGDMFVSFLINVEEVKDDVFTFTLACPGTAGMTDGKTLGSDIGRIVILPGSTDDTFKIGMSKYASAPVETSGDLALNTTHLVVISYTFIDDVKNDIIKVWVNPSDHEAPPATNMVHSDGADASATRGIQGVYLRQGSTASKNNPTYRIDAIRAATTWAELFSDSGEGGGGDETPDKPAVAVNKTSVDFGDVLQGNKVQAIINVKGENLTDDITVTIGNNAVTADVTTITAEEAMAAGGKNITLTYTAGSTSLNSTLTLSSDEIEVVSISLKGNSIPVTNVSMLGMLSNKDEDDYNYYCYTGSSAVVTFVDTQNKYLYLQDISGAIVINYGVGNIPSVPAMGDKLTDIYLCVYSKSFGVLYFMPVTDSLGTVNGTGSRTPSEVIVSDIKTDPESYLNKLVTVKDITFNATGNWASSNAAATTENGNLNVRSFPGTDLVGTPLPASTPAITGIITSANSSAVTLSVRSSSDVVMAPAAIETTTDLLINQNEYQEIGEPIDYATITVKATNLSRAADVYLTGTNRDMFGIDVEAISAGSSETVIHVTYNPTKSGSHSATLTIDATPTELSKTFSLKAKAYDPKNPPVIEVNTEDLVPFESKVGETPAPTQTISYTSKNLLDYGSVKVEQTEAVFSINNTMLMKEGTYNIVITFNPKSEGDFTGRLVFSADMAETVYVELLGSTNGGKEEETKQGDDLTFDMSNPYPTYSTDFENAGENYKPLQLAGWKNVAVEGTRAWWSYALDGNRAAYVSAYDSQTEDSTPCEMLLLSPALDYANSPSRLLQFSIMGKNLAAGMNDQLEVLYIDATGDEPYYEAIGGLNIPASADYNEEWFPYIIDLDGLELAETFFIGFRFKSLRGKESTAQYYIDDFAWGNTDAPFIRVDSNVLTSECAVAEDHTTDVVTVTGMNLTSDIKLSLSGVDAKYFQLSDASLPAVGGKFSLSFKAEEKRLHEAYVGLKADNAPETLVYVAVDANKSSGIDSVVETSTNVDVYDLQGVPVILNVPAVKAMEVLRDRRGELFIIRCGEKSYKYLAK